MRQIVVYGKGGIGKSVTTQNLAAALASSCKRRVLLVGCDPKADSTRLILGRMPKTTVLDVLRQVDADEVEDEMFLEQGFAGISCVESGGPEPGVGCAGRGIIAAIEQLECSDVYREDPDYVLYDVLGDVVCGGFAVPIREGKAKEIYIVVSGEFMSLYAANNICKGIVRYANTGGARLAGIICNCRNVDAEAELVNVFAQGIGSSVICSIPRDNIVQRAEVKRRTVIEHDPESAQAAVYRELARIVDGQPPCVVPEPMDAEELESLMVEHVG